MQLLVRRLCPIPSLLSPVVHRQSNCVAAGQAAVSYTFIASPVVPRQPNCVAAGQAAVSGSFCGHLHAGHQQAGELSHRQAAAAFYLIEYLLLY